MTIGVLGGSAVMYMAAWITNYDFLGHSPPLWESNNTAAFYAASTMAVLGLSTYLFAPPAIHLVHQRPGGAAWSFTIRLLALAPGAALTVKGMVNARSGAGSEESTGYLAVGGVLMVGGLGVGMALDDKLTWGPAAPQQASPAPRVPRLAVAPTRDGALLSLAGAF